jgi:hypothetical protein
MSKTATPLFEQHEENSRAVPARNIPVPQTVSVELQRAIALPLPDHYRLEPGTIEEWRSTIAALTTVWAFAPTP